MKKIFYMAKLNIENYKKESLKSKISLFLASTLLLIFGTISFAISKLYNNYNYQNIELREIYLANGPNDINDEKIEQISKIKNVQELYIETSLSSSNFTITFEDVELKTYIVNGVNVNYESFSLWEKNEKNVTDEIIIGRKFRETDKKSVLIDENLIYLFGFEKLEDVLNKKISIKINDQEINDLKIVGAYNWKFGSFERKLNEIDEIERKSRLKSFFVRSFLLSDDIINYFSKDNNSDFDLKRIIVYSNSADNVEEICEKIRLISENEIDNQLVFIKRKTQSVKSLNLLMIIISLIIFIFAIISIINMLIIKINNQEKVIRIMQKIGYNRRNIFMIYILENLIAFLKTAIIAIIISLFVGILIDNFLYETYRQISTFKKFLFLINPIFVGIYLMSLALILTLITYITTYSIIKRSKIWK